MEFKTKEEVLEACFYVVNTLLELGEKINGVKDLREVPTAWDNDYRDIYDFTTRVAKAVATKVLDKDFQILNGDTLKKVWFDEAVNVTNEMIKDFSRINYKFFGYELSIEKKYNRWGDEVTLYIAVQDGRKEEIDDIDYIENRVKDFVAEDILRIATGRTLSKKTCFAPDERNEYVKLRRTQEIISEIASCIGDEISYDTVSETLENNKVEDKLIELCKKVETAYEQVDYN